MIIGDISYFDANGNRLPDFDRNRPRPTRATFGTTYACWVPSNAESRGEWFDACGPIDDIPEPVRERDREAAVDTDLDDLDAFDQLDA
jgi:hypothetical protein